MQTLIAPPADKPLVEISRQTPGCRYYRVIVDGEDVTERAVYANTQLGLVVAMVRLSPANGKVAHWSIDKVARRPHHQILTGDVRILPI